jgi:hypothetical protein
MATKYTLRSTTTGDAIATYARKDAAIKAAERESLLAFSIETDSGKVVHEVDNRPETPTEAPAPEATEEENTVSEQTATPEAETEGTTKTTRKAPTGTPVPISAGSKAQASAFGASGVALAESMGLEAQVVVGEKAVYVSGNKTEVKRFTKQADAMWAAQAEALKGWKKENKDARREQFKTPDGQRQMLKDELAFVEQAGRNHLSASDVI